MGTLYIVATPIGNMGDITKRAIQTLESVDITACEDTRRAGQLFSQLAISPVSFVRYDNHTEHTVTPELIEALMSGKNVALISDAGTPLLSDPGYVLVRECRNRGISVISIPGSSAFLTALACSGLPIDKFVFLGYPPEKQSHRKDLFLKLLSVRQHIHMTYILYCAPHKLLNFFSDMQTELGNIDIVVMRELTKVHEEYWHGSLQDALKYFVSPKGEFVILFRT